MHRVVRDRLAIRRAWERKPLNLPDSAYEWKAVTLLSLGFGLVGLDRWIIAPLFPFMMRDLHLGYQALGNLIAVLGLCWGVSAIITGAISDRIGRTQDPDSRDPPFFAAFRAIRTCYRLNQFAAHPRHHGHYGRFVLSSQRCGDRRCLAAEAKRTESRSAVEYVCALWFGFRPNSGDAALARRSLLALGFVLVAIPGFVIA